MKATKSDKTAPSDSGRRIVRGIVYCGGLLVVMSAASRGAATEAVILFSAALWYYYFPANEES